jgi:ribose transport system permease protein
MSAVQGTPYLGAADHKSLWQRVAQLQLRFPILQLLILVAVYVYGVSTLPGLGTWSSMKLILTVAALAGLAATGQTLLILMGGFDLSIAGFIVASGLIVTQVREAWGIPFWVALLVALGTAVGFGAMAGQICHRLGIQPLIVTLAVGTIVVGLAQTQTPEGFSYGGSAPDWLIKLASPGTKTFGIDLPPLVSIWIVVAIAMTIFLHRTVAGRYLLATGAQPRAAEYSLIRTRRVWTLAFVFSAVASVFVGLAVTGFGGAIIVDGGNPYLFQSVIAVIVGGTIFGGPGDYLRTVLGALIVTVVNVVLVGKGLSSAQAQIVFGISILVVVTFYGRERRLRDRM